MKLRSKKLLCLVADGTDAKDYLQLRRLFEQEGAEILVASTAAYSTVETVEEGKRGADIPIDLSLDTVAPNLFDGVLIPDGNLAVHALADKPEVQSTLFACHVAGLPIFASGEAVELLYTSSVLSRLVLVRQGTPTGEFINHATHLLLDAPNRRTFAKYLA